MTKKKLLTKEPLKTLLQIPYIDIGTMSKKLALEYGDILVNKFRKRLENEI